MHVGSHARAGTFAGGKDKIRDPDMAVERGPVELTPLLIQQLEGRNLTQNRKRLVRRAPRE